MADGKGQVLSGVDVQPSAPVQRSQAKFRTMADLRNGEGASNIGLPKIFTLAEVLRNLAGICGRTFVLEHLKQVPEYNDGPTHRRIGNKIVFFEDDIPRFMESLERTPNPNPAPRSASERPSLSADKAYRMALRLVKRQRENTRKK